MHTCCSVIFFFINYLRIELLMCSLPQLMLLFWNFRLYLNDRRQSLFQECCRSSLYKIAYESPHRGNHSPPNSYSFLIKVDTSISPHRPVGFVPFVGPMCRNWCSAESKYFQDGWRPFRKLEGMPSSTLFLLIPSGILFTDAASGGYL